jgi:hypothetical protein
VRPGPPRRDQDGVVLGGVELPERLEGEPGAAQRHALLEDQVLEVVQLEGPVDVAGVEGVVGHGGILRAP